MGPPDPKNRRNESFLKGDLGDLSPKFSAVKPDRMGAPGGVASDRERLLNKSYSLRTEFYGDRNAAAGFDYKATLMIPEKSTKRRRRRQRWKRDGYINRSNIRDPKLLSSKILNYHVTKAKISGANADRAGGCRLIEVSHDSCELRPIGLCFWAHAEPSERAPAAV
jgi:hypothetical protein